MTKNETKVAVVTGAASGIGRATVIALLNQGFHIAAMDVDADGLDKLSDSLQSKNNRCDLYTTDVASREQCHSNISKIFEKNWNTLFFENYILKNNKFYIQSGAGIVADSVPEKEYLETVNKAKALINSLN